MTDATVTVQTLLDINALCDQRGFTDEEGLDEPGDGGSGLYFRLSAICLAFSTALITLVA